MRVLVTNSAEGAEGTLKELKGQLQRGCSRGTRTKYCAMMSDDLLGRGDGLVTIRCRKGGLDLSLLTMVLGTAEVFPIGNDEFRLKLAATQTVESVTDALRKTNHDLKSAGKPPAFRALFNRLGEKMIWEDRLAPLVGLKAQNHGWSPGGDSGGGGFVYLSGIEPGLTMVFLRRVLRHFQPGIVKDVLWVAAGDNEVYLRVKVGDVMASCRHAFTDPKLDIRVTACREEDLPKGIEWNDKWSPFEDEESPSAGEVDNDDLDPEIDTILRLLTNHYGFGKGDPQAPTAQGGAKGAGESKGPGGIGVAERTGSPPRVASLVPGDKGGLAPREAPRKRPGKGSDGQAPGGRGGSEAGGGRRGRGGSGTSGKGRGAGAVQLAVANTFEALQESEEDGDGMINSGSEGDNSEGNSVRTGRKRRKQSKEGGRTPTRDPVGDGIGSGAGIAEEHGGPHLEVIGSDDTEEGRAQRVGRLLAQKPNSRRTYYQLHLHLCSFLGQTPLGDTTEDTTIRATVKAQRKTIGKKQKLPQKAAGNVGNAGTAKKGGGKGGASTPSKETQDVGLAGRRIQATQVAGEVATEALGGLEVVTAARPVATDSPPRSRTGYKAPLKKQAQTRLVQSQIKVIKTPTQGTQNKRDHSSISPSKSTGVGHDRRTGGCSQDGGAAKKGRIMIDVTGSQQEDPSMDTSNEDKQDPGGGPVIRTLSFDGDSQNREGEVDPQDGSSAASGVLGNAGVDEGVGLGL